MPEPLIPITAALNDPNLFGPHFKGKSWTMWRAYLKALFGLEMTPAEAEIYRTCTGRADVGAKAYQETSIIIGRRGGKSRVMALISVFLACFVDYHPRLAPGEKATVACLCVNRDQARSVFRYINGLISSVPLLAAMVDRATESSIELNNDVVIEVQTASFRVTRGYSFACVILDECAFFRSDENSASPDIELARALRPGLATLGGMLIMASSPYAKRGVLWNSYRRHYGQAGARVLCWKAPTRVANPLIPQSLVDEALEEDPEAARAEYLAEFRSDIASFIDRDMVEAVTAIGRAELPPIPGVQYTAFLDAAGGSGSDSMALAVAHLEGEVAVLDFVLELRPPFNPDDAVVQCVAALNRYGITRAVSDRWGGEWVVIRFRERGIELSPSAKPKSDIYHDTLPMLTARRVELLDNPRLVSQLTNLERRVARSGRDSIDHAPNMHDDVANAVCGALVYTDLDRRPALVRQSDLTATNGAPYPLPDVIDAVFAVVATNDAGDLAVVYCGVPVSGDVKLILLDFQANPVGATLLRDTRHCLDEFTHAVRVRFGALKIFAPASLAARHPGCEPIPDALVKPDMGTLLRVSGYIGAGTVKLTAVALDRARSLPVGGALEFRAGDTVLTPLRLATVAAVALTFD